MVHRPAMMKTLNVHLLDYEIMLYRNIKKLLGYNVTILVNNNFCK